MEILKTKNIYKEYGKGGTKVTALKDINISVNKGEFVAIIGPSGSGKSTLLHMLGALDKPSSGKIIIDGVEITDKPESYLSAFRRQKVGFIFQSYNLVPVLNSEENICLPILLDNKKPDMNYINEIIDTLGLRERRNHLPSELSGGQQQRVSIARALACRPSIILADEPTGNLDSKNSKEVLELLKSSVKKYNETLIIITHDKSIANEADRLISIEDGEVMEDREIL